MGLAARSGIRAGQRVECRGEREEERAGRHEGGEVELMNELGAECVCGIDMKDGGGVQIVCVLVI